MPIRIFLSCQLELVARFENHPFRHCQCCDDESSRISVEQYLRGALLSELMFVGVSGATTNLANPGRKCKRSVPHPSLRTLSGITGAACTVVAAHRHVKEYHPAENDHKRYSLIN